MSSCRDALLAWALLGAAAAAAGGEPYPGIGRSATASELAAWDRDVRPDFKGLPAGRGSVAEGQVLWEARCAACHGVFGESNEWTQPLSGGTDAEDIRRGRAARLADPAYPQRSSLMKLATLSTLWDAIARSMPWDAPGTLSADETYAVTAYLLHLEGIVDAAFVLDRASAAAVQQRLPNRHGMQFEHALWPGGLPGSTRRPDTRGDTCRRSCPPPQRVVGFPPGHARDAHGELAEQNRLVGAQRGAPTSGAAR
ncbi:MAG: cytochrome c [Comamonadaceae bacterium]|nr:cytochrome c [Comamonadaceae bacterium]